MPTVNMLWSGGWDGTFRMLQLASSGAHIHPVYVIDPARDSREYEIRAMKAIIAKLRERFGAEIDEITFYEKSWILKECADAEISAALARIREKWAVGGQYRWFAMLCKHLNTEMECGVVHQYHGKVEDAVEAEARLVCPEGDELPGRWRVVPREDGRMTDTCVVFEHLILPIIRLSKEDELRIAKENGWMDIMELSWFCHSPVKGKPCGLCSPCDDAIHTGMAWRLPKSALRRYKFRSVLRPLYKVKRHLFRH